MTLRELTNLRRLKSMSDTGKGKHKIDRTKPVPSRSEKEMGGLSALHRYFTFAGVHRQFYRPSDNRYSLACYQSRSWSYRYASGWVKGVAFALIYGVASFPFAWLADRRNRVAIISVAVVFWRTMAAFCGFAKDFAQLIIARKGVGIGEAGCSSPAH